MNEQKKEFKPVTRQVNADALLFNKGNYQPTEIVFRPSVDDIAKDITNICGAYLTDIKDVIFTSDHTNGAISCYVIIPSNSKSIRDSAKLGGNDASVDISLPSYSKELQKVIELYGMKSGDNNKPVIWRDPDNRRDCGIKIDLLKIFEVIFDTKGFGFKASTGDKSPNMDLAVEPGYVGKEGRFDRVTHFTVYKRLYVPRAAKGKFRPSVPIRIK